MRTSCRWNSVILPEAATLVQKLMINGIEVQQAAKPFHANGREYAPGTWVILMDQPFSPLVKELFEPQHYPELRESPSGPPKLPYDVTGWTLPMQMGVLIAPVLEPVPQTERGTLRRMDQNAPPAGNIDGTGSVFTLSHKTNASFKLLNSILDGGGRVSFSTSDAETTEGAETGAIVVTGVDRDKIKRVAGDNWLKLKAGFGYSERLVNVKKARVGLYRSWVANIDEGWTRWILENYDFGPVTLRNGDIQAGNLRDHFDAIILPDAMPETIRNGFGPGSVPGMYTGGIGELGASALREFVQAGGTLIAFQQRVAICDRRSRPAGEK